MGDVVEATAKALENVTVSKTKELKGVSIHTPRLDSETHADIYPFID
jgi:hypothetical protein